MTSCTPLRPRARSDLKNPVQKRPVLTVADIDTEHFPVARGGDTGGDDDRPRHDPAAHPRLHVGGIREDVRERPVEAAGAEHLE